MSYHALRQSDGVSVIVHNIVRDTAGVSQTVSDDIRDTSGTLFTIFGATIPVVAVRRVMFILSNKRFFKL